MPTLLEDEQLELPGIDGDRFVRYSELKAYGIPFSRQHIAALEEQDRFPKRYQLSARIVAWRLSEIREWMASRRGRE
jgi:prophage regulatory protein